MKQNMKKTRTNVWMNDKKWIWRHPTDEGLEINLMSVAKSICLTMDVDAICDEAEAWVRKKGVEVKPKGPSYIFSSNKRLERMWNRTNDSKGKIKVRKGGIVLKRNGYNSGRGGPTYGISLSGTDACCVDTIIHEFAHVVHLLRYNETIANGRRRPHDLLYNRIMLKMMQAYCGIPESQTNPIALGWSIGNGYAPTRKIEKIHEEMVKSKDPKVMRWFTKSKGLTYEKELIEKKKQKKPRNTRQKGIGIYKTPKGEILIDYRGGRRTSWSYVRYEVELPEGYNWCGTHHTYCETLREAYQYLGTYDKDAKQYTADGLDKCDKDCPCGYRHLEEEQ